jgi:drug/metabolite transporter (DMT)-like permease
MGRRIITGVRVAAGQSSGGPAPTTDDYLSRLAKYIPAEIVGLYLFVTGVIPQTGGKSNPTAQWVVFAVCCVLTFVYMWHVTRKEGGKPLWWQIILATIAFPVWVFAIGGPFKDLPWYESWIAALVLGFTTVVFGMVRPAPGT